MGRTTNRGGAGSTLLGIQVAETVEAVGEVITRGKTLARQLLLTASAQETVLMPRLVMVGHTPGGDWLIRIKRELSQEISGFICSFFKNMVNKS